MNILKHLQDAENASATECPRKIFISLILNTITSTQSKENDSHLLLLSNPCSELHLSNQNTHLEQCETWKEETLVFITEG